MRTNSFRAVACAALCAVAFACAAARADEKPAPEKTCAVNFEKAPWEGVLAWYAKLTGLKSDPQVLPRGTLTLKPGANRKFTAAEITDLLNEALVQQKLILLAHRKSFVVVSATEKINPKFIPAVELKDLPRFGRTVWAEVAIPLPPELDADDVGKELKKLLTPMGEILHAKGQWVIIRDTVGNIERIRAVLRACGCEVRLAKKPAIIPLAPGIDPLDTARKLRKLMPAGTLIGPVPFADVLFVYATEDEVREIRWMVRPLC